MEPQAQLCQNCHRNPSSAVLLTQDRPGGPPTERLLCSECMERMGVPNFGAVMQQMLGSLRDSARDNDLTVQSGPVSHPDPSEAMQNILHDSMFLASQNGQQYADTPHMLGALLRSEDGRAALVDAGMNASRLDALQAGFEENIFSLAVGDAPDAAPMTLWSPNAVAAIRMAQRRAAKERSRVTELRHMVHGIIANANDPMARILTDHGVRPQAARTSAEEPVEEPRQETPALDAFGRDLTRDAADGKIDPVIGRADEIERTIEVLARRRKNNAVLIGEPGVGKTAIVEGLALRIVNEEVPETLHGVRVIALDLALLVAGSAMRGAFESRLKTVVEEVVASEGKILLFIDELHNLLGAGSAEGSMDAANLLKPALARGEMQTVGATTLEEYRKIERDGALKRRFEAILVEEPSVADTIDILRGLKESYEEHHKAVITDEAIAAAATLSDRYITEAFMPDKAIDLIDQAGAKVRLRSLATTPAINELRTEMEVAQVEKDTAVAAEDFPEAERLKERIAQLSAQLTELHADQAAGQEVLQVLASDVTEVVARKTGIPVGELMTDELARLRNLEDDLHERVVGQDPAVELVSDAVRRARAGLANRDEPLATFLFAGPTGVGKTELAKTLAERLFGTEDALIRIDMSEYREGHNAARLVGSPPGYIGHGRGGQLTEPVRRRPYSVVLLDEIEKAHPDVHNTLLQVMDDGRLTDGEGRTADFRNCVLIMTTNLGAGPAKRSLGFASAETNADSSRVLDAAKRAFLPEFFNRIDEVIVFNQLTDNQARSITEKLCGLVGKTLLDERDIHLTCSSELLDQFATDGFDEEYGARPLRRHIRRTLEKALTDAIIDGRITTNQDVEAVLVDGEATPGLVITARPEEAVASEPDAEPAVAAAA